jgi:uncharacterized membrane protein YadS
LAFQGDARDVLTLEEFRTWEVGMKTSFNELFTAGWRPVTLMFVETAWIPGLVLVWVKTFF